MLDGFNDYTADLASKLLYVYRYSMSSMKIFDTTVETSSMLTGNYNNRRGLARSVARGLIITHTAACYMNIGLRYATDCLNCHKAVQSSYKNCQDKIVSHLTTYVPDRACLL